MSSLALPTIFADIEASPMLATLGAKGPGFSITEVQVSRQRGYERVELLGDCHAKTTKALGTLEVSSVHI